jgi:hypothetical protein
MRLRFLHIFSLAGLLLASSCNESPKSAEGGPIVLGDPSTIVTETDTQYLRDMVMDFKPVPVAAPVADTTLAPTDTVRPAQEATALSNTAPVEPIETGQQPAPANGKGLKIDLGETTLFIAGIEAKGKGTSFQLRSGTLNGKEIKISGGRVEKISQRYQTVVVAQNNLGTLVLDNLNTTTGWQPLRGTSNTYSITGLDAKKLAAPRVSPSSIQNAVSRAAKKKRMSKKAEQKWLSAVRKVRSANQKPLSVKLRSVMWKIDGKDSKGKPFSKQVRIDLPV